jgi:hypothetical protein
MIGIVEQYNSYIRNLPILVKESYYKAEYFIKSLNISEATYYRKLRENAFTSQEVTILTDLLFPDEVLLNHLKKSEDDIREGRVEAHEVVKEKLQAKYSFQTS